MQAPCRDHIAIVHPIVYNRNVSVTAEQVAQMLALPAEDRAYLARELIASLDDTIDADREILWDEVLDRRGREIEEGTVTCRPVEEVIRDIQAKLDARRQSSRSGRRT